MAINYTTLFTQLGKAFNLGNTLIASAAVDVPGDLDDLLTEVQTLNNPIEEQQIEEGTRSAREVYKGAASAAINGLVQQVAQRLIVYTVEAEQPQPNSAVATAVDWLIADMRAGGESLNASTPAVSITYGTGAGSSSGEWGDNSGSGLIVFSTKRPDGLVNEFILAETLEAEITAVSSNGSAIWRIFGEPTKSIMSVDWPGGSGTNRTLTSHVAASSSNLIDNGGFEAEHATVDDLPDGWIVGEADLGTTLKMTPVEIQTVTVNGTPTGGYYTLSFTDSQGRTYTTSILAYNATQAEVQAALRLLPGLDSVTVTTTGTTPNLTHTITFIGVPAPEELTADANLTGGTTPSIVVATTESGSDNVSRGARCLEFDGNGSEETTLYVELSLSAKTQYAICLWALVDVVPAAGVLTVDLTDSIGGSTLADDQGESNGFTVDCTDLGATHQAQTGVFRTPTTLPPAVYLRLKLTTPVSAGTSLFIDELAMVAMTELYTGGLWAAAFSGPLDFELEDVAEATVTNDQAGEMHVWLDRVLGLRTGRKLFPTDDAGGETVDDALIA